MIMQIPTKTINMSQIWWKRGGLGALSVFKLGEFSVLLFLEMTDFQIIRPKLILSEKQTADFKEYKILVL